MITWRDVDGVEHELVQRAYLNGAYNPRCTSGYRTFESERDVWTAVYSVDEAIRVRRSVMVTCLWCVIGVSAAVTPDD